MRLICILLCSLMAYTASAQTGNGRRKKDRVPSYFGLQIRPVFPTRFIGESEITLEETDEDKIYFTSTMSQRVGYSFGATVRAGLGEFISLETGINFTQRNFDITYAIPDSNIVGSNDLSFISYDIPINALFYIRLADKWYMNASLGVALNFSPTHVKTTSHPETYHYISHSGYVTSKFSVGLNANVGFEFRTEKIGFFYLGGSANVPFKPIFDLVVDYNYQGYHSQEVGGVDGSFFSLDVKYFFPNIRNKGTQPNQGPIVQ
ncbi:MAG: outer membrane beta-barrel protein [Crocinitomicaceae bacterium]|nr:outer membrane beta-barrel protein [Crocinitomicaceae bacterium]